MAVPTTYSYPLPEPGEEWVECDCCKADSLKEDAEDYEGQLLCWDCLEDLTDPTL